MDELGKGKIAESPEHNRKLHNSDQQIFKEHPKHKRLTEQQRMTA